MSSLPFRVISIHFYSDKNPDAISFLCLFVQAQSKRSFKGDDFRTLYRQVYQQTNAFVYGGQYRKIQAISQVVRIVASNDHLSNGPLSTFVCKNLCVGGCYTRIHNIISQRHKLNLVSLVKLISTCFRLIPGWDHYFVPREEKYMNSLFKENSLPFFCFSREKCRSIHHFKSGCRVNFEPLSQWYKAIDTKIKNFWGIAMSFSWMSGVS